MRYIAVLAADGKIPVKQVTEAIKKYDIAAEAPNPPCKLLPPITVNCMRVAGHQLLRSLIPAGCATIRFLPGTMSEKPLFA